jgi:hypothetical protein
MRLRNLILILLLAWPTWAGAFQDPQPAKGKSLTEQASEIEAAYQKKIESVSKKLQDTTDETERGKLADELTALQKNSANDVLKLVRDHAREPDSLALLKKIADNGTFPEAQREAAELMLAHHVTRAGVGEEAPVLAGVDPGLGLKFARAVYERNPNKADQAIALFTIGFTRKQQAAAVQSDEAKREPLVAEAKKAFETAKEKYPDVKIGDALLLPVIQGQLAGLKNIGQLLPGKLVPDISGEDLDGKAFKLSDYQGKVVLLDFWAHW